MDAFNTLWRCCLLLQSTVIKLILISKDFHLGAQRAASPAQTNDSLLPWTSPGSAHCNNVGVNLTKQTEEGRKCRQYLVKQRTVLNAPHTDWHEPKLWYQAFLTYTFCLRRSNSHWTQQLSPSTIKYFLTLSLTQWKTVILYKSDTLISLVLHILFCSYLNVTHTFVWCSLTGVKNRLKSDRVLVFLWIYSPCKAATRNLTSDNVYIWTLSRPDQVSDLRAGDCKKLPHERNTNAALHKSLQEQNSSP